MLEKVVTALQRKGYEIQATVYSNRVARFTGGSKVIKKAMKNLVLAVGMFVVLSATAQQGVRTVDAPYVAAGSGKSPVDTGTQKRTAAVEDVIGASPNLKIETTSGIPVSEKFVITQDDESLNLVLRRWSAEKGYQLVWDAPKDLSVKKTEYEAIDILDAVEQVMGDTESSGYPLHACTYKNNVIRVLHTSQSCERK